MSFRHTILYLHVRTVDEILTCILKFSVKNLSRFPNLYHARITGKNRVPPNSAVISVVRNRFLIGMTRFHQRCSTYGLWRCRKVPLTHFLVMIPKGAFMRESKALCKSRESARGRPDFYIMISLMGFCIHLSCSAN